jgi:hypothetical protein
VVFIFKVLEDEFLGKAGSLLPSTEFVWLQKILVTMRARFVPWFGWRGPIKSASS